MGNYNDLSKAQMMAYAGIHGEVIINLMSFDEEQVKWMVSKKGKQVRLHYRVLKSHRKKVKGKFVSVIDEVQAIAIETKLYKGKNYG